MVVEGARELAMSSPPASPPTSPPARKQPKLDAKTIEAKKKRFASLAAVNSTLSDEEKKKRGVLVFEHLCQLFKTCIVTSVGADGKPEMRNGAPVIKLKLKNLNMEALREVLSEMVGIEEFVNLNQPFNQSSSSFLHSVVWARRAEMAKWFLAFRADPNYANKNGDTPMHFVCRIAKKSNSRTIMRLLAKAGANLEQKNNQGFTPLDIAEQMGYLREVKQCLQGFEKDSSIHGKWRDDCLAFHSLLLDETNKKGGKRSKSPKSKVSFDPGINELGPNNDNPKLVKRAKSVWRKLVGMLANSKNDLDELAFKEYMVKNRRLIVEGYLDLDRPTSKSNATLLHAAVYYGKTGITHTLVGLCKVNPNVCNNKGNTALHMAVERLSEKNRAAMAKIVHQLLAAGCDPSTVNRFGNAAGDKCNDLYIASMLKNWPMPPTEGEAPPEEPAKDNSMEKQLERKKLAFSKDEVAELFRVLDVDGNKRIGELDLRKALSFIPEIGRISEKIRTMLDFPVQAGNKRAGLSFEEFTRVVQICAAPISISGWQTGTMFERIEREEGGPGVDDAKAASPKAGAEKKEGKGEGKQ